MPKFGCLTNPYRDILSEVKIIGKLGFDFAEIAIEEPVTTPQVLLMKSK
jgi:hypothetical protein